MTATGERSDMPSNLGSAAYDEMKDRLMRGTYRPGTKLTVRLVADTLGVSSTPARDAINRLAAEAALAYAGPKTVVVPVLTEADLHEITAVRIALEGLAAEQAVKSATSADVDKLVSIQMLINSALDASRYEDALSHNKEFHFLVYRLSGFRNLVAMIETQWLRVGPSFHDLYPEFALERQGVRNHEMAMEALADRDGNALRAAFENDIREGSRRLRKAIGERRQRHR
ncbi:GntR family transcriptional regulator [Affinirhizobium pseudoryzae]|uniref:GntR family transcriptional regulator n=1 Tax=Allorhizobium pseudoryzae TaxID=379684 RepID=UPI0013EC124B|nr:GntR family transcriptional regulator [Allorhizobium pseudoryzae]